MNEQISTKKTFDSDFDFNVLDKNNLRGKKINYIKTDICISEHIKKGYYWELWMLKYIKENYLVNTNMIDVGANIGTTTLLMSEVLTDSYKIHSIEPIYNNILLKNVIDNNLENHVNIYSYGLGNQEKNISIKAVDLNSGLNFGATSIINRISAPNTNTNTINIKIVPLDLFCFDNVSVIKIDVEGMEIEALEGGYNLISQCKPTILIETYKIKELKESNIFKKLEKIGYKINSIPEGYNDFILQI